MLPRLAPVWLTLFVCAALGAQATTHSLTGVVIDESGRPIEHAFVGLDPGKSGIITRTSEKGSFRFLRVPPGTYRIVVNWVGHEPYREDVEVRDAAVERTIVLQALPAAFQPRGIAGVVVARETLLPVAGATVWIPGTTVEATADANGHFVFPPSSDGRIVVAARHAGYQSMLHAVEVVRDSVIRVGFVLDSVETEAERRLAAIMTDFERRTKLRGSRAAIVAGGGPEFTELSVQQASGVVLSILDRHPTLRQKGLRVGPACVYVTRLAPSDPNERHDLIDPREIEAIEVYASASDVGYLLRSDPVLGSSRCGQAGTVRRQAAVPRPGAGGTWTTRPLAQTGFVSVVVVWLKSVGWDTW